MKKYIVLTLSFLFLIHCGSDSPYSSLTEIHKKEKYPDIQSSELNDRITPAPEFVLEYLKELDGNSLYRNRSMKKNELKVAEDSIKKLPLFITRTMKSRLLGIYFIDNFTGSGLTDWAVDTKGRIFCYMVFNPKLLHMNMNELLTEKENSAFTAGSDSAKKIIFTSEREESAFFYILLHESFHLYDYVHTITPYIEPSVRDYFRLKESSTEITRGIWCDIATPCGALSHTGSLSFYGLGKKPALRTVDAELIYDELSKSPFISLYGTLSWSEDLAELGAFYHLTQVQKNRYFINVTDGKGILKIYEPATFSRVRERFPLIKALYSRGRE